MATYVWNGTPGSHTDWSTPVSWLGGVAPDAPDAQVIFPAITASADGNVVPYYVAIAGGETFSAGAVSLSSYLVINGTLDVTGAMTVALTEQIDLGGGTLSVGSLDETVGNFIIGVGTVETTGRLVNRGLISGTYPGGSSTSSLTLAAPALQNDGIIDGYVTLNTPDFTNLSNSTLTGGSYDGNLTIVLPGMTRSSPTRQPSRPAGPPRLRRSGPRARENRAIRSRRSRRAVF